MNKILLTAALVAAVGLPSFAEYVDTTVLDAFYDEDFDPNYGPTIYYYVLDEEAKTVALDIVNRTDANPGAPKGDFVIPSTATRLREEWNETGEYNSWTDTYTVVQVNRGAFMDLKDLTSVTIPASVKVVGQAAFTYCDNLESITFEESDEPIEIYYLSSQNNTKFHAVNINRSIITMGVDEDAARYGYPASNYFPEKSNWDSSQTLDITVGIGAKVQSLGEDLFKGNFSISRVDIANWGEWFKKVKLGNIYSNPYAAGTAEIYTSGIRITTFEIPADATEIADFKTAGLKYEGELILPEGLKRIGDYAFSGNKDLYYIYFPESLEEIGNHAFDGCSTLRFDALPDALKSIGDYAFTGCDMIAGITLPSEIESLGEGVFSSMAGLTKAVLFSNLTELPAHCLANNPQLANVYLPKRLLTIGESAFMQCDLLEEITFPETLTTIGNYAFAHDMDLTYPTMKGLTNVKFPSSLKEIGDYAFYANPLRTLEIPDNVESVGSYAFAKTCLLSDIKLSESLTEIKESTFWCPDYYSLGSGFVTRSSKLNSVKIPSAVTKIGQNAFDRIIGEISIADGVETLETGSLGITSIATIGSGVKKIEKNVLDSKYGEESTPLRLVRIKTNTPPTLAEKFNFTDTEYDNITLIVNDGKADTFKRNPYWEKFNIVEESKSEISIYVSGEYPISEEIRMQAGAMPSTVSKMNVSGTLAESDFRLIRENMLSLYSLNLAAISNTDIPDDAFTGMDQLTEFTFPANTTKIGARAFRDNTLMDTPALPESITEIGEEAFKNCTRLSITSLPEALETISQSAFYGCKALRSLTAGSNLKALGQPQTEDMPEGEEWWDDTFTFAECTLLEFVDFGETSIEVIPKCAFSNCSYLTNIILPNSLKSIGDEAFANTNLESIAIPDAVSSIAANAFNGSNLRSVTLPEAVTAVAEGTFANNPRLVAATFPSTLKSISADIFQNSLKLSAISCSAIDAPEAATGAFNGIRASQCSLTVPQQSFRSYLNAPQWGMFSELFNRIVVEIPEVAEVTGISEEEYQEILEEERLEAEVQAPIEDEDENLDEDEEDVEETPAARRRAVRRAAKEGILNGASFAKLFNGAMVSSSSSSKGTRIFINLKDGATLTSVIYNGIDVTGRMEGNSLLLEGVANGTLQINTEGGEAAVDEIEAASAEESAEALCEVYDLQGRHLFSGRRSEISTALPSGLYLVRTAAGTEKIAL